MIQVTGSAGHLGEAIIRTFQAGGVAARGLDQQETDFTDCVGSIVDSDIVDRAMQVISAVLHTATLHKPHVVTH